MALHFAAKPESNADKDLQLARGESQRESDKVGLALIETKHVHESQGSSTDLGMPEWLCEPSLQAPSLMDQPIQRGWIVVTATLLRASREPLDAIGGKWRQVAALSPVASSTLRYEVSQLSKDAAMAATTMVHVRVDEQIKAQATETLAAMGLSVSDAVRVFLMRVVAEQQMPFALKAPNTRTRAAMAEANEIARTRRARFKTASALFDDLEKNSRR